MRWLPVCRWRALISSGFRTVFADIVKQRLEPDALERRIASDGELTTADFSLALARELAQVSPWGQGFPEPRFDGRFTILSRRIVGGSHARLELMPESGRESCQAIAFGAAGERWFVEDDVIHAVYKLDINDYGGVQSLQLVIDYAESA